MRGVKSRFTLLGLHCLSTHPTWQREEAEHRQCGIKDYVTLIHKANNSHVHKGGESVTECLFPPHPYNALFLLQAILDLDYFSKGPM